MRKDDIIQLLKDEPNDVFLNYALALEYISENNLSMAQQQLEKTLQLNPEYVPVYYQIGMLFYQLEDKEKAIEYLDKGLRLAQKNKHLKTIAEFQSALMNVKNDLL